MRWLTLFGFMSGMAVAETHDMGNMQMMSAGDAQIVVTINAEARVSAVLVASPPVTINVFGVYGNEGEHRQPG